MTIQMSASTVHRVLLICAVFVYCVLGAGPFSATATGNHLTTQTSSSASGQELVEEFSFHIDKFKMDHQGEVQTLNIKISVQYVNGIREKDYPDFRSIARDVETLLSKYPNKTDYWEIVNKNLTQVVLGKYPHIARVMSAIEVSASSSIPYVRSSTVTRVRTTKRTAAR
jgi:hypothetical protein